MFTAHPLKAESFKLTIYTEHFTPYNFKDNSGQLVGINLDIIKSVCVSAQIICEFELFPWKRAYSSAQKNPHSAIISIAKTNIREPLFNWVGPLASSQTFFYKLKTNQQLTMSNLNDAKQYSLGIVRGGIYELLVDKIGFKAGENLLTFGEENQYMDLFLKKKIDLILGSEFTIKYQLEPFGYKVSDVVRLQELPIPEVTGNYIAFNKSVPDHIIKRFNKEYKKLKMKDSFAVYKHRYIY